MKKMISMVLVSLFMLACGKGQGGDGRVSIVTTVFPLYDFSKNIGQNKVTVSMLLPPATDVISYKPTAEDIKKVNESSIFVYTGKEEEPWVENILQSLNKDVAVVEASAGIEKFLQEHKKQHVLHKDSHVWLDFFIDQKIVSDITKALVDVDYANRVFYLVNAKKYKQKLFLLGEQYKTSLVSCKQNAILYGGHFVFNRFLEHYGLHPVSLYKESDLKENQTSEEMLKIFDSVFVSVNDNNYRYLYHNLPLPDELAETASNAGIKLLSLHSAENISQEDFSQQKTFMNIMEENLNNLKLGLNCK